MEWPHRCSGKTAGEMHGCQTQGKCSIIQAEIASLTLTPFPLRSQGSCWVVALDGLLNASLSGAASLMNTAALAAASPVTGVWLLKAAPPSLFIYCSEAEKTLQSPQCPHVNVQQGRPQSKICSWYDSIFLSGFFPLVYFQKDGANANSSVCSDCGEGIIILVGYQGLSK